MRQNYMQYDVLQLLALLTRNQKVRTRVSARAW